MARQEKGLRTGLVIKLSNETVQKLSEEEQPVRIQQNLEKDVGDKSPEKNIKSHGTVKQEIKKPVEVTISSSPTNVEIDKKEKTAPEKVDSDVTSEESKEHSEAEEQTENSEAYKEYAAHVTYEGQVAVYTDPTTNYKYVWDKKSNSWIAKSNDSGRVCGYENDTHVFTDPDGSKFFWDKDLRAWLPKVDDDFMALYQMSYGFVDNKTEKQEVVTEKAEKEEKQKEAQKKEAGVKRKVEPQWFEPSQETNTKVYVSNLPLDITEEEFVDFMQKCGLVERDPSTQKMKIKLYMDKEHNCFKGDALCTYIKIESVDLALKILDGSDFKGNKIKVEKASFQLKGDYNPALKPKKKKKKELEKLKKMQQKLFDWRPEKFIGERSKHERVVIVKNLFHPTDFDKEVQLILDYQQDLREEATKCGEVRKVVIYDRHPEGVAQITMKEPEMADAVVQLINGRWFGKRQITAEIWDGRTKYRIAETDADINKRIDKWGKFLDGKEEDVQKPNEGQDPVVPNTEAPEVLPSTETIETGTVSNTEPNETESKNMECIETK